MSMMLHILILTHYLAVYWCDVSKNWLQDSSESTNTNNSNDDDGSSVIGFTSAVIWLIGMTVVIAVLSNYIITTIEVQLFLGTYIKTLKFISSLFVWQFCFQEASESLGIPLRFISIILLPIVGNAAEHAGAIIFAFKNKIVWMYSVLLLSVFGYLSYLIQWIMWLYVSCRISPWALLLVRLLKFRCLWWDSRIFLLVQYT